MRVSLLVLCLCGLMAVASVAAPPEIASLKGVKSVQVRVTRPDPMLVSRGLDLDRDRLMSGIRQQLTAHHLVVSTDASSPVLQVQIGVAYLHGGIAAAIHVDVMQTVQLNGTALPASTWSEFIGPVSVRLGRGGCAEVEKTVQNAVHDFLTDYDQASSGR